MEPKYKLDRLLRMSKKELIVLGGHKNAEALIKYLGYLPSRKQLARKLAGLQHGSTI